MNIPVLDTNLLLADPELSSYSGQLIYIPIAVYKELDNQKTREGVVGFKARAVNRRIKNSSEKEYEDEGVKFDVYDYKDEGMIYIIRPNFELEKRIDENKKEEKADDSFMNMSILDVWYKGETKFTLHTADFSLYQLLRIASKKTEFIKDSGKQFLENIYEGYRHLNVDKHKYDNPSDIDVEDMFPNEYAVLNNSKIVKYKGNKLMPIKDYQEVYKITGKNQEQRMLIDALTDTDIKVVVVTGKAGSGKTLLSLASALHQTEGKNDIYDEVILAKSLTPLSKYEETGFLPGSLLDKLLPQFANYTSNLEVLCHEEKSPFRFKKDGETQLMNAGCQILESKMHKGTMTVMPLDSVLGASFKKKFIIVDEAQSLDFETLKCLLTRISDDCKLVLSGDILQKTAGMQSPDKSALYIANRFLKKAKSTAIISLSSVERGKACDELGKLMMEVEY